MCRCSNGTRGAGFDRLDYVFGARRKFVFDCAVEWLSLNEETVQTTTVDAALLDGR